MKASLRTLSRQLHGVRGLSSSLSAPLGGGVMGHASARSPLPLAEHYSNSWPSPAPLPLPGNAPSSSSSSSSNGLLNVPERTIPDSKLRFQTKSTFAAGSSIFYPHMKFNPADFKVALVVLISDLGLTTDEQAVFIEMVGPRYNQGKRLVRLTADRFTNRIENKKYLIMTLEKLLLESKRIAKLLPSLG